MHLWESYCEDQLHKEPKTSLSQSFLMKVPIKSVSEVYRQESPSCSVQGLQSLNKRAPVWHQASEHKRLLLALGGRKASTGTICSILDP
ncbi:hypothetical protein CapIbe_010097 [Capra ibex]